ncbi:helix-turn-helix domain-containing protein [Paenibacillus sp. GCM10023250]|uniref:helix-turn-helix domain-containing protein n=1 Tax=Paenibacillus sp. GCM10023250 TaxID=3252648 RepID=UPI0036076713
MRADTITSRAGISKGSLFHYFKSKRNLFGICHTFLLNAGPLRGGVAPELAFDRVRIAGARHPPKPRCVKKARRRSALCFVSL